ncbi:MAG: RNA pseudouridine synthase [Rhizobiales bacterium 65-9]|nr:RluA family pseudouridine synthase [Hyphomicrobiales bacterium]OJY32940.1 MAG: RNA pseudouridine synthase [Rhizobiales bacterium 65-9]
MAEVRDIILNGPAGARLDAALGAALEDFSRTRAQALIRAGSVKREQGALTDPAMRLPPGPFAVTVTIPEPAPAEPAPEPIPLDIVHEDADLIVIDKPAGLVVHPSAGHQTGTLVNALLSHCAGSLSGVGGVMRPGIVHRLDKETSGLIVVAKNDRTHRGLAAQFADHGREGPLQRRYLAVAWGAPKPARQTIDAAIDRHPHDRERMSVVRGDRGRHAITHMETVETFRGPRANPKDEAIASLVHCTLETGRTHQIRVHMAHIGHPLLGDPVYGTGYRTKAAKLGGRAREALDALGRQALHAGLLGFEHPATSEALVFERPPPSDMRDLIEALRDDA